MTLPFICTLAQNQRFHRDSDLQLDSPNTSHCNHVIICCIREREIYCKHMEENGYHPCKIILHNVSAVYSTG